MNEVVQHQSFGPMANCQRYRYCASRGGHAPGHLRDALLDALESTIHGRTTWWDALQLEFHDEAKSMWWEGAAPTSKAVRLLGQLWNCTDILPGDICCFLELPTGRTYARLARRLKAELADRS